MTDTSPTPPIRELAVVDRDTQLRALANPERSRILDLLVQRPGTAKQVADWIGGTRGRVHYHIKELEKAGLVEIVSRVERGGVVEKYYRAIARNFCLAQGIGEHAGLTGDLRNMIAASMLDWHRERILEVDQKTIARRIVADCLDTRPGQLVLIKGDFIHRDIIEAFHLAVDSIGAHGIVHFRSQTDPRFLARWAGELSSVIVIEEPLDHLSEDGVVPDPEDPARQRDAFLDRIARKGVELHHAGIPGDPLEGAVHDTLLSAGVRLAYLAYPTPQRAQLLGVDFRLLHDACWTALDVDYAILARDCERVRARIARGRDVHLRSRGGTDLRFRIEGREVFVDDGIISPWEVENKRAYNHFPAGKLIVAPIEESANGVLHSEIADYLGILIKGIRLTFRDGELIAATADENEDLLQRILSVGDGASHRLGAVEVGMNPRIENPIGYFVMDTKAYGGVTVGIGENRGIGGTNAANLAWGFGVVEPRLTIDGELVLRDRRFVDIDDSPGGRAPGRASRGGLES